MEHHTFICGTSKSKEEDAYYIHDKNNFWGTLYRSGITDVHIRPEDYRQLGKKYGIYLTEIVNPEDYRIPKDSNIEPYNIREGIGRSNR